MFSLSMTVEERALLAELTTRAIIEHAERLKPLDAMKQPNMHAEVSRDFNLLCSIHACLTVDPPTTAAELADTFHSEVGRREDAISNANRQRNIDADGIDQQYRDLATREGVDPVKELDSFDPRASHPHCTHGIPFKEPCETCNPPGDSAGMTAGTTPAL